MKFICKSISEFSDLMLLSGYHGAYDGEKLSLDVNSNNFKIKPNQVRFLEINGFQVEKSKKYINFLYPDNPKILNAWKLLSCKSMDCKNNSIYDFARVGAPSAVMSKSCESNSLYNFACCLYNCDYSYWLKRIELLLGLEDDFFEYVNKEYKKWGYKICINCGLFGTTYIINKVVSGLQVQFYLMSPNIRFIPVNFVGVKAILENPNDMSDRIKRLLIKSCAKCKECMGCTKGGKSKIFTVTLELNGVEHRLCPQFPEIEWCNNEISKDAVDTLIELNELQEKYGVNWKK